jgi:hypothetical protein
MSKWSNRLLWMKNRQLSMMVGGLDNCAILQPHAKTCCLLACSVTHATNLPTPLFLLPVEWMTKKLIPIFPDLEERACEIFQWDVKDWRALDKRVTGPEFEIGGYKWQVEECSSFGSTFYALGRIFCSCNHNC